MAAEKNIIVVLEPVTKTVSDLLKVIEEKELATVERVATQEEAVQSARQYQPCMLIACLMGNADLAPRVSMFKGLESNIKSGTVKIICVSKVKNKQIGNLIASMGVTDFMEEPVPLRTLQFKVNIQLKAVDNVRKIQEAKKASAEKVVFKKSEGKTDAAGNLIAGANDAKTKLKPALQLKEDTFLFKNSSAKKIGKKLTLEADGPDPSTGEWVAHEDKGSAKTAWRWLPNDEKEKLKPGDPTPEGWVHEGDKPQFQETTGKWQLSSEAPDLSYYKQGTKIASKVSTDETGEISVAEDSEEAEKNIVSSKALGQKVREADPKFQNKLKESKEKESNKFNGLKKSESQEPEAEFNNNLGNESEEEAGPTFSNKTGGAKEEGTEIRDRTGEGEPEEGEKHDFRSNPFPEADQGEEKKKKGLNPLDFLAKKKKQLEDKLKGSSEDSTQDESAESQFKQNSDSEIDEIGEDNTLESAGAPENKSTKVKKSAASAAQEALERMKRKLGGGESEEAEFNDHSGNELENENASHEFNLENQIIDEADAEDGEDSRPALKKKIREKKGKASKDPLDAEAAEDNEKLGKETKKKRKKEILRNIQELLGQPVKESLTEEERADLKEALGIPADKEISDKELSKKSKLEKIKKLKEGLLDLDSNSPESKEAEFNVHDISDEDAENTWSKKAIDGETVESKRRAFDSDLAEDEEDSSDRKSLKNKKNKEKEASGLKKDLKEFFLPRKEIQPLDGAWESAGDYYVYLGPTVRYHGFDRLEQLLPLWYFTGHRVPELLDKTDQWRFKEVEPQKANTNAEIPRDVRDFLLKLRDQIKPEEGEEGKKGKKASQSEAESQKKAKSGQADSLEEIFSERKAGKNVLEDRLRSLKEKMDAESEDQSSETSSELEKITDENSDEKPKSEEEGENADPSLLESHSGSGKKLNSALQEKLNALKETVDAEESTAEKNNETEEPSAAEKSLNASEDDEVAATEQKKKKNALQEKLEALKAKITDEESSSPETETSPIPDANEPDGAPKEKLKGKSAAIDKFLERRKAKAALAAQNPTPEKPKPALSKEEGERAFFLGVLVTLSNCLGPTKNVERSVQKVLNSVQEAMANCSICVVQLKGDEAVVKETATGGPEIGATLPLTSAFHLPIKLPGGEVNNNLGYLYLGWKPPREGLSASEQELTEKVAVTLGAIYAKRASGIGSEESKAA